MDFIKVILIGIALSIDAFAVSVTNGIYQTGSRFKQAFITAFIFGLFQAFMPFIGWTVGIRFYRLIDAADHWIVFGLLLFVGAHMIYETGKEKAENEQPAASGGNLRRTVPREGIQPQKLNRNAVFDFKILIITAFATSIDALTVGVSFAFSGIVGLSRILWSVGIIGIITTAVTLSGFFLGRKFGARYQKTAGIAGGLVLIGIGIKVLIDHHVI